MTEEQRIALELAITQCETQSEFEYLVNEQPHLFAENWGDHFRELALVEHGLSLQQIADACDISYSKARAFCVQVPAKRIDVIMLAMLMGMTVEQANDLLVNWAKYHRLYAKNPGDVICIYLLVVGCREKPAKMYKAYQDQYTKLLKSYGKKAHQSKREDTLILQKLVVDSASGTKLDPNHDENFVRLMQRFLPQFSRSYEKLSEFIDSYFSCLEEEDQRSLHNPDLMNQRKRTDLRGRRGGISKQEALNKRFTPNECFASDVTYRQRYYKAIKNIRKEHTVPDRLFLVSLGVRLHMTVSDINKMLDLAGMGPLYANDRLEAAIVYVLEEVLIQNPSTFFRPSQVGREDYFDALQEFCMEDELLRAGMASAPDADIIWSNFQGLERLSEQDLSKYLKWKLEDMNIDFGLSEDIRSKLLGLL